MLVLILHLLLDALFKTLLALEADLVFHTLLALEAQILQQGRGGEGLRRWVLENKGG